MGTLMTRWIAPLWRSTVALTFGVILVVGTAGYFGGRALAISMNCTNIGAALSYHRQTVYDPATDTVTVSTYDPAKGYETDTVSFRADLALRECGKDNHVVGHVNSLRRDYQQAEKAFCQDLKLVVAGDVPVPVKDGKPMNLEAAKAYVAKRC